MPIIRTVVLLCVAAATAAVAQAPMPRRPEPGAPPPAAQMLLAQAGQLDLTDAQVVKLAAIARRSEARRRSMQAAMDSAQARFGGQPGDSVARRQFGQRMQADMQRAEEQMRIDQRDAIAVLTADQQAKAWNMVSNRGPRMGGGRGMSGARGMGGGRRMGAGRPMGGGRGMGANRMRPPRLEMRERPLRAPRPPEL